MTLSVEQLRVIQAQSSNVIAHFCDQLRVVDHINASVKWDPIRSEMSPGEAIKALVINLLVRREPLYRVEDFYAEMDISALFGRAWRADDFHDDRLGAALEKLAKSDLPQVYHMFGLGSVQGLPLFADVMHGNTSDKKWNGSFAIQMAELLPSEQLKEMIVIADSAMVSEENLHLYADRPFISRFPETYSLCQELKDLAFRQEADWVAVGALSDKPGAATYRLQGMSSELYGRPYRFAVVHSSALDQRKQHKIDRDIAKERSDLNKILQEWAERPLPIWIILFSLFLYNLQAERRSIFAFQ